MSQGEQKTQFGKVLRDLFVKYSSPNHLWTPSSFAQAYPQPLDVTLVRRWLSGERVPARSASHLRLIAQTLQLTKADTSCLMEAFHAAVQARKGHSANAQVYSIIPADIARQAIQTVPRLPYVPIPSALTARALPPHSLAVRGAEEVARLAITMLASVPEVQQKHARTLYLTYNGRSNFLPDGSDLNRWWERAMWQALDRGWDVVQIVRLDSNLQRSMGLVDSIRKFVGTSGTYYPFFFKNAGTLDVPADLFVVPGIGALQLYGADQSGSVDAAIYMRQVAQVALLVDHVQRFLLTDDVLAPLLRSFPSPLKDNPALYESLLHYEEEPTGIFVATEDFPESARPPYFLREGSTWLKHMATVEQLMRRRIEALHRRAPYYPRRFLASKHSLRTFAATGRTDLAVHHPSDPELPAYGFDECYAQIEHLIHLLEKYDKYEIALLDDPDEAELPKSFWEVIDDRAVILITWQEGGMQPDEQVRVEITEPTIVNAFRAYADRLWSRVSPDDRDKRHVMGWLQGLLDDLMAEHRQEIEAYLRMR